MLLFALISGFVTTIIVGKTLARIVDDVDGFAQATWMHWINACAKIGITTW